MATQQRQPANDDAADLGKRLFSFVVVADTHINQEEGKASSDFPVNRLANARNRFVIHEINRIAPAFVLHLGDIVHPTPIHPAYGAAADTFRALARDLKSPLYLTPGNHDVGDKPGNWLPVPSVTDEFLAMYERQFGKHFYAFDANGCHFIVIDAQIINSGLECEQTQKVWLEQDLEASAGKRVFLCTHYPPYLYEPGEDSHYDNIDEPGRSWLLRLFERHSVEAVFSGHVHNFWYHLHGNTDMYLLPSTAFVRLDYSEMFRIDAGPERGRNDAPKLGFFAIDVHERGHVAHPIRTFGATLSPGQSLNGSAVYLPPVHTKSIKYAPVGLDLRYPWAEAVEVPPSGALDEFSRKLVRNDYPLGALWEMGVRRLRVPLRDLANPVTRERMRVLRRMGHTFTVYSHRAPEGALAAALIEHAALVASWEIIAPWREIDTVLKRARDMKLPASLAVYLSKLQRHDDEHHHGQKARHVIEHGFYLSEREQVQELLQRKGAGNLLDGCVFRVARDSKPWDDLQGIARAVAGLNKGACAYVRLAADNPAQAMEDDLANANRVAETVAAAYGCRGVTAWLDTFNDVDRGYFPRTGLVDRRYNPRMAFHVYRNLHSAFGSSGAEFTARQALALPGARAVTLESAGELWYLLMPERETFVGELPLDGRGGGARSGRWIDLVSGEVRALNLSLAADGGQTVARIGEAIACRVPSLVCIGPS